MGLVFQYLPLKGPSSSENEKREFMCNHQPDKVHVRDYTQSSDLIRFMITVSSSST